MSSRFFIIFCLVSFILIIPQSYAMDTHENEDWRTSLNVIMSNTKLNFNKWHREANQYINDQNRGIIQSRFEKTEGERNIASFRFFLYYRVEGSTESLKAVKFDPPLIFISGLSKFNNDVLERNDEQYLRNKIKNARSFQDENLEGGNIISHQYQALTPFISNSQLTAIYGTRKNRIADAEVSIIRFLSCKMPNLIQAIFDHERDKITIVGSIFQIASLFDSCKYCFPVLSQYGNNLKRIIEENIFSNVNPNIKLKVAINPTIENLLLISGTQVYGTSRDNAVYKNESISMDFAHPSVRIILARLEDLNEQGVELENFREN